MYRLLCHSQSISLLLCKYLCKASIKRIGPEQTLYSNYVDIEVIDIYILVYLPMHLHFTSVHH